MICFIFYAVFWFGVVFATELRAGDMEMSCMQVSWFLTEPVIYRLFLSPALILFLSLFSKTALLEGLEVDQYMWGILNAIQK